jgi:putative aldouronate transport system substrate-binding protein
MSSKALAIVSMALVILLVGSLPLFAGAGSDTSGSTTTARTKLSLSLRYNGRTWDPAQPNLQKIMELTNTDLDVTFYREDSDLDLLMASGQLPDIITINGMNFQNYIDTGYLLDITDLLKTNGQQIVKVTDPTSMSYMVINGKTYAYPFGNFPIKYMTFLRKDWLDAVGVDLSQNEDFGNFVQWGGKYNGKKVTLDQFYDICQRIANNDPDGNGKKDTYALVSYSGPLSNTNLTNIMGTFGGDSGNYNIVNGKAIPWITTDGMRKSLEYAAKLWAAGAWDPESYILSQREQSQQKIISGQVAGETGAWWSEASEVSRDGFWAAYPNADFIPILLTSNDGKTNGVRNNGTVSSTISITTQSKNPTAAMNFLNFMNTDQGWYLIRMGIEGKDYNMVNGEPVRTTTGTQLWSTVMDPLYTLSNRTPPDLERFLYPTKSNDHYQEVNGWWGLLAQDNTVQTVYNNDFFGIPAPQAFNEYGVDVNNYITQASMEFVTGATPINDTTWNAFIAQWKRLGGVKILQGYIDNYNKLKGTNITAGITE